MVGLVTEVIAFVEVVSDPGTEPEEDCYYFLLWGCSEGPKSNLEEGSSHIGIPESIRLEKMDSSATYC